MKILRVTETAVYEFKVPDDFGMGVKSEDVEADFVSEAEDFFCNHDGPREGADSFLVEDRQYELLGEDGESLMSGEAESM